MARKTKAKTEQIPIETDAQISATPLAQNDIGQAPQSTPMENKDIFTSGGELVVDVFETQSNFMVLCAIAGVQIKDLDISIEKDMMVIKGERVNPHNQPEKNYFYQECYWGPFSRKIVLPENINTEAADAQMDKGLLTITIPKIDIEKGKRPITELS